MADSDSEDLDADQLVKELDVSSNSVVNHLRKFLN
jgi:hypothetical protein